MERSFSNLQNLVDEFAPYTNFDVSNKISKVKNDLNDIQKSNIISARSYYILVYTYLFPEEASSIITHFDVAESVIIDPFPFPETAETLTSQIMCVFLRLIKTNPKDFVNAIMKSFSDIPIHYFSFVTFPALFGFFTSADFCENAVEFVLELFEFSRNETLISNILLSFFFSSFSFMECLWHCFSRNITSNPSDSEIEAALKKSIVDALPKLPQYVYVALLSISGEYSKIFKNVTKTFIEKTYIVWQRQSGECISLNDKILRYMTSDATYEAFLCILSAKVLPGVEGPSYWRKCGLYYESMLFSSVDLKIICDIVKNFSNPLPLWSHIEKITEKWAPTRFKPYAFTFFKTAKIEPLPTKINMFGFSINDQIKFENNQVYEQALKGKYQNLEPSKTFLKYKMKTEINQSIKKIDDLDVLVTLMSQKEDALSFGYRIRSTFYLFAGMYYIELLKSTIPNIDSSDITRLMKAYCFDCKDKYLAFVFLTEIINKMYPYINCISHKLIERFDTTICKRLGSAWERAAFCIDREYCTSIISSIVPKRRLKNGELMKILDSIFCKISDIISYKSAGNDAKSALYEFSIITGDHAMMLKLYFFLENVLFKYTVFDLFISRERSNNWLFFADTIKRFIKYDAFLEKKLNEM